MPEQRILTTHTGSLPRPDDLIQIMWAKGDGIPVDEAALSARVASAVQEIVDKQVAAGISVVNDGEMSKPSYATYVKDRLSGFGGESIQNYFFADLEDFPRSKEIVAANPGRKKRSAPACNAPIAVADEAAAALDMVNLNNAVPRDKVAGTFSSAASPGVVSIFFGNEYYKSDEEYVFAIAEAMRHEYEAIVEAGRLRLLHRHPEEAKALVTRVMEGALDLKVPLVDRIEHGFIRSQKHQDKGSGNTGQDHGTDRQRPRKEEVGQGCLRLGNRQGNHGIRQHGPHNSHYDHGEVPAGNALCHIKNTCQDQAEEKGPQQNGLVGQQPADPLGEGEHADGNSAQDGEEEASVELLPERPNPLGF